MSYRSEDLLQGSEKPFYRSIFKSMGYSDFELDYRPMIGIANPFHTLRPGHRNLDQVCRRVSDGILAGGGTPCEFGCIAQCDAIGQGVEGMHYMLPHRDLVANSVESEVRANRLDGIVMLASCDKIVPGMLMAAARLDIPALIVCGGPMLGGIEFDGRQADMTSADEAYGMLAAGKISRGTYDKLENLICPGSGSCSFFGTANSMCSLTEAMGMMLPGGAIIPAVYAARMRHAFESGLAIVDLCRKGITARQIINEKGIRNTIRVAMAEAASTNSLLHLCAIAHEAEADIDIIAEYERFNREIPQILKVNPASKYNQEDYYKAGGVPRVMKNLGGLLELDAMTVSGKTVGENLEEYVFEYPENTEVVKYPDAPFQAQGGIQIMRGNIAPETGVAKPGAIKAEIHQFTGKAICFDSEEECNQAIIDGKVVDGDVVVLRYEGPKGGPGMREMYKSMKYLHGRGLDTSTALITDGRFSGTNNGCFVGHISPEAADGGPLAAIRDGDIIDIDVDAGTLNVRLSDEEIAERLKDWKPVVKDVPRGYLRMYQKLATSAAKGGYIDY